MNNTIIRILLVLLSVALTISGQQPAAGTRPVSPKSIILIVSDGTGLGQQTYSYYQLGNYAQARFGQVALMTTHPADSLQATDSAAAATTMSTGVKTYNGAIGMDVDRQPLKHAMEYAREHGMATGLVATSTITHATPAGFIAHVEQRGEEAAIAREMATAGVDVIFGGGRKYFVSRDQSGEQDSDLLAAMASRGVQVIDSLWQPVDPSKPVIGLFSMDYMPKAVEGRRPTTTEMALRALELLDDDPDGFFLMVEESQVDWAGHDADEEYLHHELVSLQELVHALLDYQESHPGVLLLQLADHETGGLAISAEDGKPGYNLLWSTGGHTLDMIPVFAIGPGSAVYKGIIDNTFIGQTLIEYINAR